LSREELIDVYSQKWLLKNRLQTPCRGIATSLSS